MRNRKKASSAAIIFLIILFTVLGYIAGGVVGHDIKIKDMNGLNQFLEIVQYELLHPFYLHMTEKTLICLLFGFLIGAFAASYYAMNIRNYMYGAEFGNDQWGDAARTTKKLTDKDKAKNKVLSDNLRMSLDDEQTRLNGNAIIVGGSGAGKSAFEVTPNIHQLNTSYVITDAKGDLSKKNGKLLEKYGYKVQCLNFKRFKQSVRFNPFVFIRDEEDIRRMITTLIANTTPKQATPGDPFWEKAESAYLQALASYSYFEGNASFPDILDLMQKSNVDDDDMPSELDILIDELEADKGSEHPAVKQYREAFKGAKDTIRSVIMCANSRLAFMNTPQIRRILSGNDINFADIGMGVGKDGKTKTALFFVIPANDKTYNSIIGMAYSVLFDELYKAAEDGTKNTRLPVPVQVYMDEFANISLPDNFENILSTCRSYYISINIILQNISQLKALYKDSWESIIGNCDTFIYLGGNEQSTHKYISELLGKWTIDKKTQGESYNKGKSMSSNEDRMGRELMTPTEVRKMSNSHCIVLIRGMDPIYDRKCRTFKSKRFLESKMLGSYKQKVNIQYDEDGNIIFPVKEKAEKKNFQTLTSGAFEYYVNVSEFDDKVKAYEFSGDDLFDLLCQENEDIEKPTVSIDEIQKQMKLHKEEIDKIEMEEQEKEKQLNDALGIIDYSESIYEIVAHVNIPEDVLEQVQLGLAHNLSEEQVKTYFKLEYSAGQMAVMRTLLENQNEKHDAVS